MSSTPDTVIRHWFKEVWDEGSEDGIDRLASPDVIVQGLNGPFGAPMRGTGEFKKVFHTFLDASTGVCIARVSDGRLVEGWNVFDFLTMYQQIGWVDTPPLPMD